MLGNTALVLLVPAVDPAVAGWRARYDPAAAQGMPAHLTVLYPFLPEGSITARELAILDDVVAPHRPFDLTFADVALVSGSLWLAPVPDEPVRALIRDVCRTWPDVLPYGGAHAVSEVIPHVTVAAGSPHREVSDHVTAEISADLRTRLPVPTRIDTAHLFAFDGRSWVVRHASPLGGTSP